jgi:hypothetical protein
VTDLLITAAACTGTLLVAGTGIAVLPWTERERRSVVVALSTIVAIVRGTVRSRRSLPAVPAPLPALPSGAFSWNSSCPPSIGSSPGTAGM